MLQIKQKGSFNQKKKQASECLSQNMSSYSPSILGI